MGEKSEVIISLFGILDVTGEVITMWIMLLVIALLSLIVKKNLKERPGKFQNIIETGIEYLDNFFSDILGKKNLGRGIRITIGEENEITVTEELRAAALAPLDKMLELAR